MAAEDYHYIGRPVVAPLHRTRRYQTPLIPFLLQHYAPPILSRRAPPTGKKRGTSSHTANRRLNSTHRLFTPTQHSFQALCAFHLHTTGSAAAAHSLKWKFSQLPQSDSAPPPSPVSYTLFASFLMLVLFFFFFFFFIKAVDSTPVLILFVQLHYRCRRCRCRSPATGDPMSLKCNFFCHCCCCSSQLSSTSLCEHQLRADFFN